jgi:hypothetical protein
MGRVEENAQSMIQVILIRATVILILVRAIRRGAGHKRENEPEPTQDTQCTCRNVSLLGSEGQED